MAAQHMLDEALRDVCVLGCCFSAFQDHVIHHSESSHQFRPRSLRQQGPGRIGYLNHQTPIWRGVPAEQPDMLGQQRIKIAGHPLSRLLLPVHALESFLLRYDFRPRVQES
jgi:hypothetical protein